MCDDTGMKSLYLLDRRTEKLTLFHSSLYGPAYTTVIMGLRVIVDEAQENILAAWPVDNGMADHWFSAS